MKIFFQKHKWKSSFFLFLLIFFLFVSLVWKPSLSYMQFKEIFEPTLVLASSHFILTSLSLILLISFLAVIPLPLETWFKLLLGAVFGTALGTAYNLVSVFVASSVIFFLTKHYFGESVQKKYAKKLKGLNENLEKNEFYYLLMLRFSIFFPFFLINVLAGLSKISYSKFALSTLIGSIPGALFYTYLGERIRESQSLVQVFSPELFIALVALLVLSAVPVLVNSVREKRKKRERTE
ncbi:MAG: VTT domain-containing protein [Nanoarchaeota archaeon]|nr:VTT domain-containing protein [Nanoarchaeota archaeon]